MSNYQKRLMNSVLAKSVKEMQATAEYFSTLNSSKRVFTGHKTIYCISPYKTGTTYLASAYSKKVSQHEPMQYLSLKRFEKDFDTFFIKRLNTLNLKLECSGFLSAYIENLAKHKIAKNLEYIVITRKPTEWINSVVNYWYTLKYLNNDYINEEFWKKKAGVDLINFKFKLESEQKDIINKLADFYLSYTQKTSLLKNVSYIKINEIEDYFKVLDIKIKEKAKIKSTKKNTNNVKFYSYKNDDLDTQYENIIKELKSKNIRPHD